MRVTRYTDPSEFAKIAMPFLMRDEARNSLFMSVFDTILNRPARFPIFYLYAVESDAGLEGLAWMTPPHPLGITAMSRPALTALVETAVTLKDPVTNIVGPRPAVDDLLAIWTERTGKTAVETMEQRVYQVRRVKPPRHAVSGSMRYAIAADKDLLTRWTLAFCVDCHLPCTTESAAETAAYAIEHKKRVLWIGADQTPVAMAGISGQTTNGVGVGAVYTPPGLRGRGYASVLVATLSQELLAKGRKFCFLYTDLANPTSNGIYQKIGYEPVGDSAHYRFTKVNTHA